MSNYVPTKQHLRELPIHYFFLKNSAYKTHQILVECYGEHALSKATCENWFKRFKSGDFDVQDKPRTGGPKKFEDEELEQLLDEDP